MTTTEPQSAELQARLEDLTTRAAAKDAVKDYNSAAELYSQATEIQAEINGEMSVENADLLYAYGKSLYNVAVSKSDVLGSKIAGGEVSQQPEPSSKKSSEPTSSGLIQAAISNSATKGSLDSAKKPAEQANSLFQFTGDENYADSDSEEEEAEDGQAEGEEEDDDFENAFEVLDLARVLLLKKLEGVEEKLSGKGKGTDSPPEVKQIQERLADIYDLQAEISLEGESFANAVSDLRAALELKERLFPFEDPSVSECHYKLSLALEFASVSQPDEEDEAAQEEKPAVVDTAMREESAKHMQSAIESCKLRLAQEEKKLETGEISGEDKVNAAKRRISNVKEIVADMEQRLIDLRRSPTSVNAPSQDATAIEALNGVLGQLIGKSAAEKAATLDQVSKGANDLSSLVRKKPQSSSSGTKRQHEEALGEPEGTKRAKTEDPA